MKLDRTYSFDDEEAQRRFKALTTYWSVKYGVKTDWSGSTAKIKGNVKGVKFDGNVQISGGRISADIKAGFLAEKLGGKKYVEGKVDDYLDPSNSVEDLEARAR